MNNDQIEKLSNIAKEIITFSKSKIILNFRFFDVPLSRISFIEDLDSFYCNGKFIIYNPVILIDAFEKSEALPLRMIIHSLFHCILGHIYVYENSFDEMDLWNACCDIAVESLVLNLSNKNNDVPYDDERRDFISKLQYKVKKLMAENIFEYALKDVALKQLILNNAYLFKMDDHTFWYEVLGIVNVNKQEENEEKESDEDTESDGEGDEDNKSRGNGKSDERGSEEDSKSGGNSDSESGENDNDGNGSNNISDYKKGKTDDDKSEGFVNKAKSLISYYNKDLEQQKDWQNLADCMITELEDFDIGIGTIPGDIVYALKSNVKEHYDYEEFLKKFSHVHEAMMINDEEFDYVLYTYGLSLYKNMPIIEPLEYKDKKLIKTFVIAIDTSASTSGALVEKFLNKTFNILINNGFFTKRCEIRIVQCDTEIQHVDIIRDLKDIEKMFSNFNIYGLGGTSFLPVFDYVDKLLENKEIGRLDGLIYFTDGQGVFPSKKPSYKSAFVFVEHEEFNFNNYDIPSWAIKHIIKESEI